MSCTLTSARQISICDLSISSKIVGSLAGKSISLTRARTHGERRQSRRMKPRCQLNTTLSADNGDGANKPPPKVFDTCTGDEDDREGLQTFSMLQRLVHVIVLSACCAKPAHAFLGFRRKPEERPAPSAESMIELGGPVMKNLGFSGIVGLAAGIAFKTVGKSLATLLGAAFAAIQIGVFLGYVSVDWSRVHKDIIRLFYLHHDGISDTSDLKSIMARCMAILSQGLPSCGGFCMGLAWGLSV